MVLMEVIGMSNCAVRSMIRFAIWPPIEVLNATPRPLYPRQAITPERLDDVRIPVGRHGETASPCVSPRHGAQCGPKFAGIGRKCGAEATDEISLIGRGRR